MEALIGPSKTRLFMAGAATESNLKAADLASTSVLFLATHGLVAGEAGDIGEPGLVFTPPTAASPADRSEEHTSEPQSLMRISYAVFCLKKHNNTTHPTRS